MCATQMYYGNADAETVTRFGLQQAMQQQQGQKIGPASLLFRQVRAPGTSSAPGASICGL